MVFVKDVVRLAKHCKGLEKLRKNTVRSLSKLFSYCMQMHVFIIFWCI